MALSALSIPATPLQMLPYTRIHRKSDQSHSLNTPHTQMQSAKSGTNAQSLLLRRASRLPLSKSPMHSSQSRQAPPRTGQRQASDAGEAIRI